MKGLENVHFIIWGGSGIGIAVFIIFAYLNHPSRAAGKISPADLFGVIFAWLDFVGDVCWTHMVYGTGPQIPFNPPMFPSD